MKDKGEKDARMKNYVKNKENLTVNHRQVLQKYTGEWRM